MAEASEHLLTQDEEDWRNPKPEDADTVSHVADVRACEHWRVVRTERVGLPGYEPLPRYHYKDSNPKRSEAQRLRVLSRCAGNRQAIILGAPQIEI